MGRNEAQVKNDISGLPCCLTYCYSIPSNRGIGKRGPGSLGASLPQDYSASVEHDPGYGQGAIPELKLLNMIELRRGLRCGKETARH